MSAALRGGAGRAVAALAALVFLAGGCGGGDEAEDPIALRVAFIPAMDNAILPVMVEQGFAAKRGLAIELTTARGGVAALEAMAAGSLDVAYPGSLPALSAARAGTIPRDVLIVGAGAYADAAHPSISVLAPASTTWSDLAGQPIAVNQPGSIGHVAMLLRLRQEGVVPGSFVEIDYPNQGLAVAGRSTAAASMVEPYLTQSVARGDGVVLGRLIGGGEPFPRFIIGFIVVKRDLVRDQPNAVRALLLAHLDAVEWMAGHKDEARAVIAGHMGLPPDIARAMPLPGFVRDARIDAALLAEMQRALVELDPALTPLALDDVSDQSLLDQVLKERR